MATCYPLHTCELCGQEGLSESDMRTHMRLEHVEGSPMCPFCDLGELSHEEMELHVNSAHLDFLTPESDDMQYLEGGGGGMVEWKSIWDLDRCAGDEGLTGDIEESPPFSKMKTITRESSNKLDKSNYEENGHLNGILELSNGKETSVDNNPFVDSDLSDTEEDTTVCSVVEKDKFLKGEPPKISIQPNSNPASPCKRRRQETPSPKLNKSHLTLPLKRPTGGFSLTTLTCPMCPFVDTNPDTLQEHVNRIHLDELSPNIQSSTHQCPLCSNEFSNPTLLEDHFNSKHHNDLSPSRPVLTSPPDLRCPVCNQTGWSTDQLQLHVESHFTSPPSPGPSGSLSSGQSGNSSASDLILAQELERRERDRRRMEEEKQFASLQAQYGMDEQGNFTQQSANGLRKAVVSGQLSVVDYYERSHNLAESERSGVDDGSSVTPRISNTIRGLSVGSHGVVNTLVASRTDHFASTFGDKGWGCGFRNLQMLLSCLLNTTQFRESVAMRLAGNKNLLGMVGMPSIPRLQKIIEEAWRAGFDQAGCEQLGGKLTNTRKWIGATEIATFLSFCNVDWEIIDFHCPTATDGSHPLMFEWILDYFNKGQIVTPPLYLQHQGHSRTVVGVEQLTGGGIKLLILDPSHSSASLKQNTMRLVRKSIASMKSKQYQVVAVRGVLDTPSKRESKKLIRSTRMPSM